MTDIRDRIETVELADGGWLEDRWDGTYICRRDGGTLFQGDGEVHRQRYVGDVMPLWVEAEARIVEKSRADAAEAHVEEMQQRGRVE